MLGGKIIGIARQHSDASEVPVTTLLNIGPAASYDIADNERNCFAVRVREERMDNGQPVKLKLGDKIAVDGVAAYWQADRCHEIMLPQLETLPADWPTHPECVR